MLGNEADPNPTRARANDNARSCEQAGREQLNSFQRRRSRSRSRSRSLSPPRLSRRSRSRSRSLSRSRSCNYKKEDCKRRWLNPNTDRKPWCASAGGQMAWVRGRCLSISKGFPHRVQTKTVRQPDTTDRHRRRQNTQGWGGERTPPRSESR